MQFNHHNFQLEAFRLASKSESIDKQIREEANEAFEAAKVALLDDFENSEITQELEGGATAANISDTLIIKSNNYEGPEREINLFTYLGFERDKNPVSKLRTLLNSSIYLDRARKSAHGVFLKLSYPVIMPSDDELNSATELEERSYSWLSVLQGGHNNIINTLFKKWPNSSRSEEAIQTENPIDSAIFVKKRYLSWFFGLFKRRLNLR